MPAARGGRVAHAEGVPVAQRLVVHIGSMKSGTSFVQNVLGGNKDRVAEHGLLFPGRRWRDQVTAVTDLIELGEAAGPPGPEGPWRAMVEEIRAWPETAVISMEFLAPRSAAKIRFLQGCFPGTDLQVVLTGRDLTRNVPAMWLESVQNGSVVTWPDFLAAVRTEANAPGPARYFWKHQGLAAISRRWVKVVGQDHFTLVTVPPRGAPPGLLWERFAHVLGIDPGVCDLTVRRNPSIGAATALVLRRLNEVLAVDGALPARQEFYVKHLLAKRGLAHRYAQEPVLGFDEPWAHRRGHLEVQRLADQGLRVVGDLADLEPRPVPGVHTDQVTVEQQLAASVDGLAHLVHAWSEAGRKGGRSNKDRKGRKRPGGRTT